jgi:hypothetical protein
MEKTNSTESLRLLNAAHTISWSSSSSAEGSNDHSTRLQQLVEQTVPRPNGWVQGKIHRDRNQYIMYLQSPDDKNRPIYMGEKHQPRGTTYVLRNLTGGIMGNLSKTSSKGSTIEYSLHYHDNSKTASSTEVATIQYQVPSVIQVLTDGPSRRAHVAVPGRASVKTKEPYCKEGGQRALDFRGRGREPSRKNMQLHDSDGTVVLQMVKWEKDQFHLDFA